jgi:hypothetical protein
VASPEISETLKADRRDADFLSPTQMAMCAARARALYDKRAKERQDQTRKKAKAPFR